MHPACSRKLAAAAASVYLSRRFERLGFHRPSRRRVSATRDERAAANSVQNSRCVEKGAACIA
jgi:hypothetical protein